MRARARWHVLALAASFLVPGIVRGQAALPAMSPISAVRLSETQIVRLDGRLDEPWWAATAPLEKFYETDPGTLTPPPVRTEARFAADGRTLYIAIKAFDPDPSALRAPIARRDDSGDDVDKVTVFLDAMGSRRAAQIFEVSASGSVGDGLFSEASGSADTSGAELGVEDRSPNYRFRTAVARFDGGWSIEMAIPFSSLRYEAGAERPWAVLVARNYPRQEAYYMMSGPIPPEATCTLCYATPLEGVKPPANTRGVEGAVTMSHRRESALAAGSPRARSQTSRAGVDLKLPWRADTHADATWRPDFSQVEIDSPQLSGNTRYAIYLPEKRQFFLEGADILESPLPVLRTRAFAAPDAGLRLTHRGPVEATALVVRDGPSGRVLLPEADGTGERARTESSTAWMVRARAHASQGDVGLVYSHRHGGVLGSNQVAGVDTAWRPNSANRFDAQWLRSRSTALQSERGVPKAAQAWQLRWFHRAPIVNVDARLRRIGDGFRADNGFFERAGVQHSSVNIDVHERSWGPLSEAGLYGGDQRETATGARERLDVRSYLGRYVLLPRLTKAWLEPVVLVQQRAGLGTVLHRMRRINMGLSSSPTSWLTGLDASFESGSMLDVERDRVGRGRSLEAMTKWQLLNNLLVQADVQRLTIAGEGRFDERTQRLLLLWHIGPQHYLRLIDQRRSLSREASGAVAASMERETAQTISLQSRVQLRWVVDAGIAARRFVAGVGSTAEREHEVYVKASFEFER